jgi:hypothetical protein
MSELDDTRLEHEIGATLRRRDPGPAPLGLRDRVARVPERAPVTSLLARLVSRAGVPALGLAAAILLLLLTLPLFLAPSPGPGPGASIAPTTTFDPTIEGPGMVTGWISTEFVVSLLLIAGVVIVALAFRRFGRRGLVAIALVVVAGTGVAGTLMTGIGPGSLTSTRGLGVTFVPPPAGSRAKDVAYITAAPGEPFWVLVSLRNEGPLPIRFVGLRDPFGLDRFDAEVIHVGIVAVWRDTAERGGSNGEASAVPLTPIDLGPGDEVILYVVGRASACAYGPTYDPAIGSTVGYRGLSEIDLVYTVFGMPRSTPLEWPYDMLEPNPGSACPPQP